MDTPSILPTSTGPAAPPKLPPRTESLLPEGVKTAILLILVLAVAYLLYDSYQFQQKIHADLDKLSDHIGAVEDATKSGQVHIDNLKGEVSKTQQAVGSTRQELKKTTAEIQSESQKAKAEMSQVNQALSSKADATQVQAQVQAARQDAEAKITSEVGSVKTDVGTVKTELANTKRDLEGTQRQLVDVRENLTAAVAKNSSELNDLRRKGERDYVEFEIPKRDQLTKVEDIRLILTKTDPKKNKYSMFVVVDDSKLEKRDRSVNEPVQFLVGHNRVRYELVVNWVQKDRVGGYLSIPKDKALAKESSAK
jgi:predicted  nucleic acid-binding Zn-ribbon protein